MGEEFIRNLVWEWFLTATHDSRDGKPVQAFFSSCDLFGFLLLVGPSSLRRTAPSPSTVWIWKGQSTTQEHILYTPSFPSLHQELSHCPYYLFPFSMSFLSIQSQHCEDSPSLLLLQPPMPLFPSHCSHDAPNQPASLLLIPITLNQEVFNSFPDPLPLYLH